MERLRKFACELLSDQRRRDEGANHADRDDDGDNPDADLARARLFGDALRAIANVGKFQLHGSGPAARNALASRRSQRQSCFEKKRRESSFAAMVFYKSYTDHNV